MTNAIANDIRDIKPPIEIPNGWGWVPAALAIIILAAITFFLWRWWQKRREQIRSTEFAQEFLRRPLRRTKLEALFEVKTDRVGDENAKFLRLRNQRQRFLELLLGADVRWNRRDD